jgi:hypothetical protein
MAQTDSSNQLQSMPKEPTTGFQLFATRSASDLSDLVNNFDLVTVPATTASLGAVLL